MPSPTASKFLDFEVTPTFVEHPPDKALDITYTSVNKKVNLGNELTPVEVKEAPVVSWDPEEGASYTLISIDPIAPNSTFPNGREILHWLVVNIPGNDLKKGEELAGYLGSYPSKGSGLHRYVSVLYKHPKKIEYEEKFAVLDDRRGFSFKKFTAKYDLVVPVAGNFYQAQSDAYSEEFHRKFLAGEIKLK